MEWLPIVYVLLEACVLTADGDAVDDPVYRPMWVQPSAVTRFGTITRATASTECTAVWIAGTRHYVVGTIPDIYAKLTRRDLHTLPPPGAPAGVSPGPGPVQGGGQAPAQR